MWKYLIVFILLGCSSASFGSGFDYRFKTYTGDLNGDEETDIFVRGERDIILIHGDIITPIVLPPGVADFVLKQTAQGSFTIVSNLTLAQQTAVSQWPEADFDLYFRDLNDDGSMDLQIGGVESSITGAYDQIVFADPTSNGPPYGVVEQDIKFQRYFGQVAAWILDPNYFEDNAPLRVTGVEPPSRVWWGTILSNIEFATSPATTIGIALQQCEQQSSGNLCGLSQQDPGECMIIGPIYDENGEYVEDGPVNICEEGEYHIFVYTPGTVEFEPDYSVFDGDAMETREVLIRLNDGCPGTPAQPGDISLLRDPLDQIFGPIWNLFPADSDNSSDHPPWPGDSLFDTSDPTYHHYDVLTKICDHSEPSCSESLLSNQVIRFFTHPSYKLQPTWTNVNGEDVPVYVPFPPWKTETPDAYTFSIGIVTQQFITQTEPWVGGIQNITTPTHLVYPGTIGRKVQARKDGHYVFTHGVGVNRAFCTIIDELRPIQVLLGYVNDASGAKAFNQLDKEMRKYWLQNY